MDEESGRCATSLCCTSNEGPSNLIISLNRRENYGRKRDVSGRYRADITFSKLECVSTFSRYNFKESKWEECIVPREPRDFFGRFGLILGLSSDATYLVMLRANPARAVVVIYFLLLSPEFAVHRNHVVIREYTMATRLRMYFHPSNRFISTFVYNESHFQSAMMSGLSEASVFHVYTLFPQYSLCLRFTSSATIVCREKPKRNSTMRKHYLKVHSNGFILNTGVTLIMMLFSESVPARLKYKQKVWRVILQQTLPIYSDQAHSITCDLGEEISVESSIRHESDVVGLSYKLVDCRNEEYCDPNFVCGLRKPFFVSRHVVCIESLIDRFMSVYIRTSSFFKGSVYRGSRDYETDVSRVDNDGICTLVILCVSELQVPVGDGEATRNSFYLFQVQVLWSIFQGWKVGGKCRIIKELKPEVAFNPSSWYPYLRFPVEKDDYSYYIPNTKVVLGRDSGRITSENKAIEVILDLDRL